jgi:hypothetical protein
LIYSITTQHTSYTHIIRVNLHTASISATHHYSSSRTVLKAHLTITHSTRHQAPLSIIRTIRNLHNLIVHNIPSIITMRQHIAMSPLIL